MVYQHIAFSMAVKNADVADPRFGTETMLSFSGVHYVAAQWDEDAKECALFHMCDKVIHNADIVAEFGKIYPMPRTFVLNGVHTPSDQALGR